jgi:hypothetical protein
VAEAEDTPLIEVRNPIQPIGSSNEAWVYDTVCFLGGSVVQPTVGLLNPRWSRSSRGCRELQIFACYFLQFCLTDQVPGHNYADDEISSNPQQWRGHFKPENSDYALSTGGIKICDFLAFLVPTASIPAMLLCFVLVDRIGLNFVTQLHVCGGKSEHTLFPTP